MLLHSLRRVSFFAVQIVLFGVLLALASCGGNSGNNSPSHKATSTPIPTPSATPTTTPVSTEPPVFFGGEVLSGGSTAISGASVTLYAAGTSGYQAGAQILATATSDSNGSFGFELTSCPSGHTSDPTYVVAIGGNTISGAANSAIGLMALTGPCSSLSSSTFVLVTELTTVAAEWALAQFIDSTGTIIGTSSTNSAGLDDSIAVAESNLVVSYLPSGGDTSNTGVPADFLPTAAECSGGSPPTNCDALERLYTLADIIAACDTSGFTSATPCSTLFTATGTSTSETMLAAAHAIVTHPAINVSTIYGVLALSASTPYQPALSMAPADLTLALNFSPSGANFNYPIALAIDAAGNVWVANFSGSTLTELNSNGGLIGNFNPTGANFDGPEAVAIDAAGDVWVPNFSGNTVTELNSSGGLVGNFSPTGPFSEPFAAAVDAAGNVWVPSFGNSIVELNSNGGLIGNFNPSGANFDGPNAVAIDAAGDVWAPNLNGNTMTELNSSGGLVGDFDPAGAKFDTPTGVAIDASGNVWVSNQAGDSVTELNSSGGLLGNFDPAGANFTRPEAVAIDAAGNVWVPNSIAFSVTELNSSGGLVGNFSSGGAIIEPQDVAIDAAGNVWMPDYGPNNMVTELIGAARPVLTPLVACLTRTPPAAVCLP